MSTIEKKQAAIIVITNTVIINCVSSFPFSQEIFENSNLTFDK